MPCFLDAALTSEQLALIDFLILANAQQFVGFGPSTFSFYMREYRALQGMHRSTSFLLDGSSIVGIDNLFREAGFVGPIDKGEHFPVLWKSYS